MDMSEVLIGRQNLDPDRHRVGLSCEDEDIDRDDAAEAKQSQRLSADHQELGKKHKTDSHSESSEGTNPVDT